MVVKRLGIGNMFQGTLMRNKAELGLTRWQVYEQVQQCGKQGVIQNTAALLFYL